MRFAFLLLAGAILAASFGCEAAFEAARKKAQEEELKKLPAPKMIDTSDQFHLLTDPEITMTLRNTGAAGRILIIVKQDREWKRLAYFDAGEERKVKLTCPGLHAGKYTYEIKPEKAATPAELQGAQG